MFADVKVGAVVLDRYRVVALLRWGDARGPVALALDQRLDRQVDLVVAPEPVGTPLGDLFKRRADAVAMLQHPALPQVLDMGFHSGHVVLVYRHAEGRLLAGIMARDAGGWTGRRALQLVAELAAALGVAHAQGVCHGSCGAHSVLLERDGTVTMLGLAWPLAGASLDRAGAAPELRAGYTPTPHGDVFALGYVLLRLIGRGPDTAIQDVVRRATAWAPRERYADGAAMAGAIGRLLARPDSMEAPLSRARPHAVPATRRPAAMTVQQRWRSILPALALGVALGLPSLAHLVMHEAIDHRPFVGMLLHGERDGWGPDGRGWGQFPWGHRGHDRATASWWWSPGPDQGGP